MILSAPVLYMQIKWLLLKNLFFRVVDMNFVCDSQGNGFSKSDETLNPFLPYMHEMVIGF